jgi:hypothetical protein
MYKTIQESNTNRKERSCHQHYPTDITIFCSFDFFVLAIVDYE